MRLVRRMMWMMVALLVAGFLPLFDRSGSLAPNPVLAQSCTPTVTKLDVVFLVDVSGSMGNAIAQAQANAADIAQQIQGFVPDSAFAVSALDDYPNVYGEEGDIPYQQISELSTKLSDLQNSLKKLSVLAGGDLPEAYARAISEMNSIGWRADATRIVVLIGDAYPHSKGHFGDGNPDPGRDGEIGTADDVEFVDAVRAVRSNNTSIVGVIYPTEGYDFAADQVNAAFNYATSGRYKVAPSTGSIAPTIVGLVTGAVCDPPPPPTDTPSRPAPKKRVTDPADVVVVLQPTPNITAERGSTLTYVVEATNYGKGPAGNTVITLPMNPAQTKLFGVATSRKEAWVSAARDDALVIQTGKLGSGGDVVTATVTLQLLPEVSNSTPLGTRLTYTFSDAKSGGKGSGNLPILIAGGSNVSTDVYDLSVDPLAGPAATEHNFKSTIFVPGEVVQFWYNVPDGSVGALTSLTADAEGHIDAVFTTTGLRSGTYSLVARGERSRFTASGRFVVE